MYFKAWGERYGIGSYRHEPLPIEASALPWENGHSVAHMPDFPEEHFAFALRETASVLPATLPLAIGSLVFSGLGHLIVLKKHHYQLVADSTRLGLMLASTWLAWYLGASGTTAILMMSCSSLAGHLIFFLAHLHAYHRLGIQR